MLVNCVGIVDVGKLHEYDEEDWDYLMGVNAKAIFFQSNTPCRTYYKTRAAASSISPRSFASDDI